MEDYADIDRFPQIMLTGTYSAKLDIKRRITIPRQMMDKLIALNSTERKLYLQLDNDHISVYLLTAVGKIKKELGQLSLLERDNRNRMEEVCSSLYETDIESDDRMLIPEKMLVALNIQPKSDVIIKGASDFFTISKSFAQ